MTVSSICVGIVLFIGILVITGLFGWFNMCMADEENMCMVFVAWILSSLGWAICLTIIFVQNNFI